MKKIHTDRSIRADLNTTREDIEAMDIDRERERDALEDYVVVEKVIGFRDQNGVSEYFVKCLYTDLDACLIYYISNSTIRETPLVRSLHLGGCRVG